jgi:integrase
MPVVSLTDRFVATIKPASVRVDYTDSKIGGLMLRVASSGVKTFALSYYSPGPGRQRARLTLGTYPRVRLADARRMALEALSRVSAGEDPRYGHTATVNEAVAAYLPQHVRPNLRSAKAVERRLRKNVLPVIGNVSLAELHRRDINRALAPILARGKRIEAGRVFEDVRAFLNWAVARGDLESNPSKGIKKPEGSSPRERVLSDEEIRTLWNMLADALPRSQTVRNVIKLCLLTGQRVGECCGITAGEIDAKKRLWTIPAARSKNKHAHTIPLTDLSLALAELIAAGDKVPGHAVAKTIRLAQVRFGIGQWTAHDLRRTVATRMAELGILPIVISNVLNHRSVSKASITFAAYAHYSYDKEKREALELWANRLDAIVSGGPAQVLPMRARA